MKYLGYRLKDTITGYEGIATGYELMLFGAEQYLLSPQFDIEKVEGCWFNAGRLTVIDEGIIPQLRTNIDNDIIQHINSILKEP